MWTYEQKTGRLLHDGGEIAQGYSGHGNCKNDPEMQDRANVGPIPRGRYRFGAAHDTESHGPEVLPLFPCGGEMFGRSGFLVHGDSIQAPGTASHGCIIMPHFARAAMANSTDRQLEVV